MAPVEEKMARKPIQKSDGIKEVAPPSTPSKSKVAATLRNLNIATTPKSKVAATARSKVAPTPRPKVAENTVSKVIAPSTIKKSRKYRPKPAHSGVPLPGKLKKLFEKQLRESDKTCL